MLTVVCGVDSASFQRVSHEFLVVSKVLHFEFPVPELQPPQPAHQRLAWKSAHWSYEPSLVVLPALGRDIEHIAGLLRATTLPAE